MNKLKVLVTFVTLMCLAFILPSNCMGAAYQDKNTTLTIAGYYDIPTLDPAGTRSGTAHSIIMAVCEKLVRFKPGTSELEPVLATRWEVSEDLKTYTFYLRKGIEFTDGTPFNAKAVKFNFERVMGIKKGPAAGLLNVKEVKIVDPYKVQFILKRPSAPFIYKVAAWAGLNFISPKAVKEHATDEDPWAEDWVRNHLVGTGPYKLVEWIPKQRVVLTRNNDYWRGWEGKHFDRIIRKVVPEYTTREMLLQKGKVDMIDFPPAYSIPKLKRLSGIRVEEYPTINPDFYLFNLRSKVMQNKKIREALSWAFPYKEALEIAGKGASQLQGPLPKDVWAHNDELFVYHTDLEKAAELLKEAGYKPGELSLTLAHYTMERNRKLFETFQINLRKIGVQLNLKSMAWGRYSPWMQSRKKGNVDIFFVEKWAAYPEPTNFLSLNFEDSEYNRVSLPFGYKYALPTHQAKLNDLLIKARQSPNKEERARLYKEAQELIVDDVLGIWAFQMGAAVAMRDYVKGFVATPAYFAIYDFYRMYKEE